jgi:hypothetical protein
LKLKKKLKPLNKLEADLWTQFSIYIRSKDADFQGYTKCYTCGKRIHWKLETDAGHYIKRSYKALKFDERNVRPQCKRCNMYMDGNQDEFADHLELDYGHGILQELKALKYQEKRFTRIELESLITHYKNLNGQRSG